jgi:hypothetical protein
VHGDDTNISYICAQSQVCRVIDYGSAYYPLNMKKYIFLPTNTRCNMANNSAPGVPVVDGAGSSTILDNHV